MTNWTKGPWYVMNNKKEGDSGELVTSYGMGVICRCFTHAGEGEEPEERDANAHLIAAAPELYDALNVMLGHNTGGMDGDWRDCDYLRLARDALAKARGESNGT